MLKKILISFCFIIICLIIIILFNTIRFSSKQINVSSISMANVDSSAINHLQNAIHFKTISFSDSSKFDSNEFIGFRNFLEKTFPLVHSKLNREIINKYSLLFEWRGKSTYAKPIILMAHQDVVPIEEETLQMWQSDPFSGLLKDNFICGRGSVDDKINLISILEATERLLKEGYQPEKTIYFVFGHDEEISGMKGAKPIAELLQARNIKAEFVIDEGGFITNKEVPGMKKPVALIGTAEKGYMSIELLVNIKGGHSSMPAKETSIDVLSKSIIKLRKKPFPAHFSESTLGFIENVGPEMPFIQKMAFANFWLFKPLIINIYEKSNGGNALIRTTIVPTILKSGIKDNVVPSVATAVINLRILPGSNSQDILKQLKNTIDDDRVIISTIGYVHEPSKTTNINSPGYKKVVKVIRSNMGGTITTPFLMLGATDSRHFKNISETILKFSPMVDPIGFHGINEKVSVDSYKRCIGFYYQLMKE